MLLHVDIVVDGPQPPPVGAPVRVQVRDTSLADVEAPLIAETTSAVAGEPSRPLVTTVDVPESTLDPRRRLSLFVHVDIDGDGALSSGDFITTQSYPVPRGDPEVRLEAAVQQI